LDLFDVEAVEAAESSIDQFIERRARQNDEANRIEEQCKASTRRHNEQREQRRRENCSLWYLHHCHLQRPSTRASRIGTGREQRRY